VPPDPADPVATSPPTCSSLSRRTKLSYGVSTFGSGLFEFALSLYLFYFYVDVVGVEPGTVGACVMAAFWIDAFADIPMGWLSDKTRTRWGRRRPYILAAAPLCGLSFFLLFSPPSHHTVAYLAIVGTLYYCSMTVFLVPYNALGAELTLDHHGRTSVMAYRQVFYIVGLVGGVGIKSLAGLVAPGRSGFSVAGALCGAIMVFTMILTFLGTRERREFSQARSTASMGRVGYLFRNRPFRIMLATYVIYNASIIIPVVIGVQAARHWLHAEAIFPLAVLTFLVCGVTAVPFWAWVSHRLDKRPALILSLLTAALATAPMGLMTPERSWLLFVLLGGVGFGFGGFITLPFSIIGDTIDYDHFHTGCRRDGLYWGVAEFCRKIGQGGAIAATGVILQALGYREQAAEQAPSALMGLKVIFVGVPTALYLLAVLVFWWYPLNRELHERMQQQAGPGPSSEGQGDGQGYC
jgi:glycoside/pentoside/hexuronide:cation symporter, GPH family